MLDTNGLGSGFRVRSFGVRAEELAPALALGFRV